MSVLDRIIDSTREDVARRSREVPLAELERHLHARSTERPFQEGLAGPGVGVIAEFKRASPSAGEIRPGATVAEIVAAYEASGAVALSVLTEERHFKGSLADLRAARAASRLPILRKDFIVEPYQVVESAVAGADAILLIVAALDDHLLADLHSQATELDLDVLVEVHDDEELRRALGVIDPDVIGINNRNLADFTVDIERTYELLTDIPAGKTVVSESGIREREQVLELERVGVDAVLVGEGLMRSPDPGLALRVLRGGESHGNGHTH